MATPAIPRLAQVLRNNGQPIENFLSGSTWVDVVALPTPGTAASYTVPTGAVMMRMTPTAIPCYGNWNGAAAAPAAGHTDGSGSFPVGGQTYMVAPAAGSTLSLVMAVAGYVSIEIWS